MKIGIIGMGKMGMLHAGILNSLKDVTLAAVADPSAFVKSTFSALKPELPFYTDYTEMLEKEELQGVFITTPVHLHMPMAMACVEKGIAVFLEKPLSIDADEAGPLLKALEEKKIVSMIGYGARYFDMYIKGKELVASGALGRTINFSSTMYVSQLFEARKGWRYAKGESGGGVLNNLTSHLVSTLYWYFGEVDSVNALVQNWYSEHVEDYFHAVLNFENGVSGWIDSSWSMDNYRMPQAEIKVHGTNGQLTVGDDFISMYLKDAGGGYPAGWTRWKAPDVYGGAEINIGGAQFTREDQAFVDAVRAGKSPELDAACGYRIQKIIDAVYRSGADNGNAVSVQGKGA